MLAQEEEFASWVGRAKARNKSAEVSVERSWICLCPTWVHASRLTGTPPSFWTKSLMKASFSMICFVLMPLFPSESSKACHDGSTPEDENPSSDV